MGLPSSVVQAAPDSQRQAMELERLSHIAERVINVTQVVECLGLTPPVTDSPTQRECLVTVFQGLRILSQLNMNRAYVVEYFAFPALVFLSLAGQQALPVVFQCP